MIIFKIWKKDKCSKKEEDASSSVIVDVNIDADIS